MDWAKLEREVGEGFWEGDWGLVSVEMGFAVLLDDAMGAAKMFEKRRQREEREENRGVGCREQRQIGKKKKGGDVGRSLVLWYHIEGKKKLVLNCLNFLFV
jgi:hypothetical protein